MLTTPQVNALTRQYGVGASEHFLYALIDHSGMPGLANRLNGYPVQWDSLLGSTKDARSLPAAPLLIRIETAENALLHPGLIDWVCEHGTFTSSVMFLASPLPMDDLVRRLKVRLDATLPDKLDVILRFFDPRTFESLLQILTETQKQQFLSVATSWWFVDRRGELQKVPSMLAVTDRYVSPMMLSVAQQGRMIDASEPDQVENLLLGQEGINFDGLPHHKRHDFVLRHSAAAHTIGITAIHEIASYCALAMAYGESFVAKPEWQVALKQVAIGVWTLQQAIVSVENSAENESDV